MTPTDPIEKFVEWLFTNGTESGNVLYLFQEGSGNNLASYRRAAVLAQVRELVARVKQSYLSILCPYCAGAYPLFNQQVIRWSGGFAHALKEDTTQFIECRAEAIHKTELPKETN